MSDQVVHRATLKPLVGPSWLGFVGRVFQLIFGILLAPFRLLLSIRRSMTGASVVLLLVGIISLNIIWGYPWVGVFSACAALFVLGWIFNRALRPSLKIDLSLPASVPAGQPFSLVAHLQNVRQVPAMDLELEFDPLYERTSAKRRGGRQDGYECLTPRVLLPLLLAAEHKDISASMVLRRRGIHPLPDLVITSMFPFYLFRSTTRCRLSTSIAVTPQLLTGGEDLSARQQVHSLGSWLRKLLAGDAMDYTGSREYQVGMPVRRWDFPSWARLGKPIIREFQSPAIRMLTLVVDTATQRNANPGEVVPEIERTLSLTATALTDLSRQNIRVQMFVTGESIAVLDHASSAADQASGADLESLLIRLAEADVVSTDAADQSLEEVLEFLGNSPTLILTSRSKLGEQQELPASASLLRIDSAHRSVPGRGNVKEKARRPERWEAERVR